MDFWRNLRKFLWFIVFSHSLFCRTCLFSLDFSPREDTLFRRDIYLFSFSMRNCFFPAWYFTWLSKAEATFKQKTYLSYNFFFLFCSQCFLRFRDLEWFFSLATATMTSLLKPSPGRRRGSDLESGKSDNADSDSDTFYIPSKNASIERLQQWRVRHLVPFFRCRLFAFYEQLFYGFSIWMLVYM